MPKGLERHHPNEVENLGDVLYIYDFYGLDMPQFVTVVDIKEEKRVSVVTDRPEGDALLGYITGRIRYIPDAHTDLIVGPGHPHYLEAIKQKVDGLECIVPGPNGKGKKIRLVGELLKFTTAR